MEARVRPARPADKAPLMSFIKDVWGGHDYIPRVWDEWLRDKKADLFVVEVGGVPVGMNRVRYLEDGSAWFEGARVHPDFRGRGLATMLGENSMAVAIARGVNVFRLTSGSRNKVAHRQIAKIAFEEIARFSVYGPPKRMKFNPARHAGRMKLTQFDEAMCLIRKSREYVLGGGFFWHDWAATSLTSATVRRLLEEGAIRRVGDAVAVSKGGGEGKEKWEQICFVGGPRDDGFRLIETLVGGNKRADERWVFLPQGSPLIHLLRKKGYKRDFAMVLFERRAAKG